MPDNIEKQLKATLDASIESMDGETEQQLIRIRQQALLQPRQRKMTKVFYQSGVGAVFSVALLIALVPSTIFEPEPSNVSISLLAEHEIFEDPELIADIEFIYWLAQKNEQAIL